MNKKHVRSIVAMILLTAILMASTSPLAFATQSEHSTTVSDNKNLVVNFWESVNDGDWLSWVSYFPLEIQDVYLNFITQENIENNVGILTVSHAEVISVTQIDNCYAPKMFPELQAYYENEATYECYKVNVNLDVKADNNYFHSGVNSFLTITVKSGQEWYIGVACGCPEDLTVSDSISYAASGIGYGLIDFIPEPTYIDVMDENGDIHVNETFSNFIFNATCNEIGNCGFHYNAV